jgi:hypothetical protein
MQHESGDEMKLWRPVGLNELRLIYESGMKSFPPRLPEQPIFYPVMSFDYADEIARQWNVKTDPFAGYVTMFEIADAYATRFSPHVVGSQKHAELWIAANELSDFNGHIVGLIQVVAAHFGEEFRGFVPDKCNLKGRNASDQLCVLSDILGYNGMDFIGEVSVNNLAVFLHYPYWSACRLPSGIGEARRREVLDSIARLWSHQFPSLPNIGGTVRAA